MLKKSFAAFLFCALILTASRSFACSALDAMPIQNHGRVKAFSAFAQETVQFITGKKTWQGETASSFLMKRLNDPKSFLSEPFVRVDHLGLKQAMSLPQEEHYFSYLRIKSANSVLIAMVQESAAKRNKDIRPSLLEQQAELLYQRVSLVERLSTGELITVIPGAGEDSAWASPYKSDSSEGKAFLQMARDFSTGSPDKDRALGNWLDGVNAIIGKEMAQRVGLEAVYYQVQPFFLAMLLYFFGFLCLLCPSVRIQMLGKGVVLLGFLLHAFGITLRTLVLMRPPVANMYETMIFMDLVLMLTVGVLVLLQKRNSLLSCGTVVSAVVMVYASILPVDKSMDVLAPVLRSSFWLTIHVITIVSSYSLFTFAMAVAHRYLFLSTTGRMTPSEDRTSALSIYRLLQTGLLLLGAGTILGGVWANEAWGRFWGWDPKETWAFITFIGYMAILHARYKDKLSNFALAVCAILGFLLVLMTWYGVNFVLGRGLHSYGSGSGGIKWIVYYLIIEAAFLVFVWSKRKRNI